MNFNEKINKYPFYVMHVAKEGSVKLEVFQNLYTALKFEEEITDARNYNSVEEIPAIQIVKCNKKSQRLIYVPHTFLDKQAWNCYQKFFGKK